MFGHPDDHRWEGLFVGGAIVATGLTIFAGLLCQNSETQNCTGAMVGGFFLGAFTGAITGGLIGGAIPKEKTTP